MKSLHFGLILKENIKRTFSILYEINLTRKGSRLSYFGTNDGISTSIVEKVTLTYLELPIAANYSFLNHGKVNMAFCIGPVMAINISSKNKFDSTVSSAGFIIGQRSSGSYTNARFFDIGTVLGFNVTIPLSTIDILFDAKYSFGMLDLFTDPEGNVHTVLPGGNNSSFDRLGKQGYWKNAVFSFSIGFLWR
jgi:hypothetical protein